MRKAGIQSIISRKWVKTTGSDHALPVAENVLNGDFSAVGPGEKWVSDLTYIRTGAGWVYLTTVIDLADRKVIGWSLSDNMEAKSTTVSAFQMAKVNRRIGDTLIFHSDILYFNRTLANFMLDKHGQRMEIGAPILKYVGEGFMGSFIYNFKAALVGRKITFEENLLHNGQEIWWQFNFSPAFDSYGAIVEVSYTATDVSELRKSKEENRSSSRALDRIAMVQSHQIRGPLSSILGLVELLQDINLPKAKEEVALLKSAAEKLDFIVRNLVTQASDHIN